MDLDAARDTLEAHGQLHVLTFWEHLDAEQRRGLLADIAAVDWTLVGKLLRAATQPPEPPAASDLQPPEAYSPARDEQVCGPSRRRGEALLRENRIAALTVAGGQGTRLGVTGPKGIFPITPVKGKSLFQHFAESILATRRRYGCRVPWYIMTGPDNHGDTVAFFEQHGFFGLPTDSVSFFQQGVLPAVSQDGKVLLAEKHRMALAPDGHGGTFAALHRSGALPEMQSRDIRYISYFQVDNPLIMPLDPLFIGLVGTQSSAFGSKVVSKADDRERVGVFVKVRDALSVIEYTHFPSELCSLRDGSGRRLYDAANVACHVIDPNLIRGLVGGGLSDMLPYHRATKRVPYIDVTTGLRSEPEAPNAIKFEQFIFDAIPRAEHPVLLEISRADQFSPVKNATGVDSPQTARRDLIARAVRWLEQCGVRFPPAKLNDLLLEISPLFALDAEELRSKISPEDPRLTADAIYLGPE